MLFFLPSTFVYGLTQPGRLGITAPLLSVLEHGFSKALPDCCHEHPNLVPKNVHEAHVLLSVNDVGGSTMYQP